MKVDVMWGQQPAVGRDDPFPKPSDDYHLITLQLPLLDMLGVFNCLGSDQWHPLQPCTPSSVSSLISLCQNITLCAQQTHPRKDLLKYVLSSQFKHVSKHCVIGAYGEASLLNLFLWSFNCLPCSIALLP